MNELELKMAIGILRAVDAGTLDQRSMAADAMYCWCAVQAREHGSPSGIEWLRKQAKKLGFS